MADAQLIEKLKLGDHRAFMELVDNYKQKVINLSYAYLHDLNEAEDIAQDVFIEVLESIGKFRGDSSVSTWLYRVTVNKSLNRLKRMRRKKLLFGFLTNENIESGPNQHPEPIASESSNPDFYLKINEDRNALHTAIDKLPANQKTAFLLSKYERLSYKEIASVMNTSLPSVESLLFRAKSNLRKHLMNYITYSE